MIESSRRDGKRNQRFSNFCFFVMAVKLNYMRSENPNALRVDSDMVYFDNGEGWHSGES